MCVCVCVAWWYPFLTQSSRLHIETNRRSMFEESRTKSTCARRRRRCCVNFMAFHLLFASAPAPACYPSYLFPSNSIPVRPFSILPALSHPEAPEVSERGSGNEITTCQLNQARFMQQFPSLVWVPTHTRAQRPPPTPVSHAHNQPILNLPSRHKALS